MDTTSRVPCDHRLLRKAHLVAVLTASAVCFFVFLPDVFPACALVELGRDIYAMA